MSRWDELKQAARYAQSKRMTLGVDSTEVLALLAERDELEKLCEELAQTMRDMV